MLVLTSASQNNFRVGFSLAFLLSGDELELHGGEPALARDGRRLQIASQSCPRAGILRPVAWMPDAQCRACAEHLIWSIRGGRLMFSSFQWPLLKIWTSSKRGESHNRGCSTLHRILVRPTIYVHARPRPPRGSVTPVATRAATVKPSRGRKARHDPDVPIGARLVAGWCGTATSPLMRCLPGVRI